MTALIIFLHIEKVMMFVAYILLQSQHVNENTQHISRNQAGYDAVHQIWQLMDQLLE